MKITSLVFLACIITVQLISQDKQQVKQQAETQLQTMTPQDINAKIKELGMTPAQAEARAKELGIDLNSYLQQKGGAMQDLSKPREIQPGAGEAAPKEKKSPATTEGGTKFETETAPGSDIENTKKDSVLVGATYLK
jgi:hypothetical protein